MSRATPRTEREDEPRGEPGTRRESPRWRAAALALAVALGACGAPSVTGEATRGASGGTVPGTEPGGGPLAEPITAWAPSTVANAHPRALAPEVDVAHYAIRIRFDHATRGFTGSVTMRAAPLVDELACVTVHAAPSLALDAAVRLDPADETAAIAPLRIERDGELARLCGDAPFRRGEPFVTRVSMAGQADPRDHYGVFVTQSQTSELPSFYTQFESQGARRALPLVDEPYDKATTEVWLGGDARYTLLSNGDPGGCLDNDGVRTCHWVNPDPISTYLITFVAAELEQIEASYERADGASTPLTIHTESGHVADGLYAMYALQRALELYEAAYGLPYPWSRYGAVALPGFRYGGMENKGLTNIASTSLYFEPGTTPLSRRYSVFGIVAHELAHEWFGNLVTMQWWDDVWLNEGFASYMTRLAMAAEFDEVSSRLHDHVGLQRWYMDVERGPFAHPIVYEDWTTPEQLFDAISYTKGRKVLEMLEALVGRDNLFAGIRRYLIDNAGSNAATPRFFDTIAETVGSNLDGFVRPWVYEAGFPEVTFAPEWDAARSTLVLRVSQRSSQGAGHAVVWSFPVQVGLAGDGYHEAPWSVIHQAEQVLEFELPSEPSIVSINRGGTALIDVEVAGRELDGWLHHALADPDAWGRGVALFEALERFGAAWVEDRGAAYARLPELAAAFRAAILAQDGPGVDALRAFALARLDDPELPSDMLDALCGTLLGTLTSVLDGPDPGDDILAVDARVAAIRALGRVDQVTTHAHLVRLHDQRIDYVVPALAALLRTSATDRYDRLGAALARWSENDAVVRGLLAALAAAPDPAIFDRLRRYLADETYVDPRDHRAVRELLGTLVRDNAELAYSDEGMAFVLEVFSAELDRSGTLIRTLRAFQDANERPLDDRRRLAAMLDTLAARLAETPDPEDVAEVVRLLRESLELGP